MIPSLPYRAGRFVMHRLRELALYPGMLRRDGLRMAVLPNAGREMASLLRGFNMADELKRHGWVTCALPSELERAQRERVLGLFRPDLALLLGSRHRDNSAALLGGIPYLYDLGDADFFDPALTERIETDVTDAAGVVAGSRFVADWCARLNQSVRVVWTGSPLPKTPPPSQLSRKRIVTWAQSAPFGYPVELDFVTDVLCRIEEPDFTFRLYGCKPGDEDQPVVLRLRNRGIAVELLPFLPYDDFLASLRDVAVGLSAVIPVAPYSRGKSFGKILGYLTAGVAIIASDEVDHARFFTPETGVVSNDPALWAETIVALLDDAPRREAMSRAASAAFEVELSTEAAGRKLDAFARETLSALAASAPR